MNDTQWTPPEPSIEIVETVKEEDIWYIDTLIDGIEHTFEFVSDTMPTWEEVVAAAADAKDLIEEQLNEHAMEAMYGLY